MALALNDFDGGKSNTRAIGGVSPENLDIFGSQKATRFTHCHFRAQKMS
jgi:hypothetical protein